MAYLLIRHRVKDFERWKTRFDEHAAARRASGAKQGRIYRNAENLNEVITLFAWEDLAQARRFAQSENLRAVMQEAGVIEQPDIYYLDDVETFTASGKEGTP